MPSDSPPLGVPDLVKQTRKLVESSQRRVLETARLCAYSCVLLQQRHNDALSICPEEGPNA